MKAILALLVAVCTACSEREAQKPAGAAAEAREGSVSRAVFGKTPDGQSVDVYTLTNANGWPVRGTATSSVTC
jgi:hypothetical protein